MVLYSVSDFMKLSLINKKIKGIQVGSIITDGSVDYPFGKVDTIENGTPFCYWYRTLEDLKNKRNVFKREYSHRDTFKTDIRLKVI